jgi:predicted Zn-dependent peptidase
LEHMCFKGTKKRASVLEIAAELDGMGAQYNAFTGQEYTGYYAKAMNEFAPRALDVVSDLYLNPTFPEVEIEKEKGVIIEEINMYEDLPQQKVGELFMKLVYGDQPAGWSIAGRKEVIRRVGRDDFVKYRGGHYVPQATVVIVAGGFDPKEALSLVTEQFGSFEHAGKEGKEKVVELQSKPVELVRHKESDQTHMVMGFRAFDVFDDRRYALRVLSDVLGGGMSSRLFQTVREKLGAAYYVRASSDLYTDHGLVAMSAGVQHGKLREVIEATLEEFRRLRDELVPDDELQRAKDHLVGNLLLSLETSDALGSFYGGKEILGVPLTTPDEVSARIRQVTAQDVQKVAQDLFVNEHLNLSLIGPFKQDSFLDILKV